MNKYFKSGATLTAMALVLSLTPIQSALGSTEDEIRLLRQQVAEMAKRLEELEAKQEQTQKEVEETRDSAVITTGKSPGSFILPGTGTEIEISGYVKGDFIYDLDESTGDVFVPESISTFGQDEGRFRAQVQGTWRSPPSTRQRYVIIGRKEAGNIVRPVINDDKSKKNKSGQ